MYTKCSVIELIICKRIERNKKKQFLFIYFVAKLLYCPAWDLNPGLLAHKTNALTD